jgi:hypothetical protein
MAGAINLERLSTYRYPALRGAAKNILIPAINKYKEVIRLKNSVIFLNLPGIRRINKPAIIETNTGSKNIFIIFPTCF